ncbi:MAG TPA: hypothetical protein VM490_18690 [Armatimonadaceae bacterium]|nr:hypothetical protein [Armatimonadaceae bacterium]
MQRRHITALTVLLALLLALAAVPVCACINDRDTLAMEGKRFPGLAEVITGRFERNPPLYYEMRVARVAKELTANPAKLDLYDDIAAALDRLGRDDEAIAWMEKKRARLAGTPERGEDWYRYHANVGTFKVHRWLHDGADRKRIGEVKAARAHIAKAIHLKPDAHFGREKYQLLAMDWIIEPRRSVSQYVSSPRGAKEKITRGPVPISYLLLADLKLARPSVGPGTREEQITGLSGLVVLGAAWESVDIFASLADVLSRGRDESLAALALLRLDELTANGRKSLLAGHPAVKDWRETLSLDQNDYRARRAVNDELTAKYRALRNEADAWQKARTEFMLARLRAGMHPDTHPDFWRGYVETPPADLEYAYEKRLTHRLLKKLGGGSPTLGILVLVVMTPVVLLVGLISFFASRSVKRRLRARRAARLSGGASS